MSELREKVLTAVKRIIGLDIESYDDGLLLDDDTVELASNSIADAVIAIVIEEASRVADSGAYFQGTVIAKAIRALKEQK